MIKVLHIVPVLDSGGIENLLLNYYININRKEVEFDFIVHGESIGNLELVFKKMNSKIYHIPTKRENFKKNLLAMKKIIGNGDYDVIHSHQGIVSVFSMYYAKKYKVKKRITHSHTTSAEHNVLQRIMNIFFSPFLKKYSTDYFACGTDAGRFLWGDKFVSENKLFIMNNAIDLQKYKFDPAVRFKVREELNIEKKFVVGTVGRISQQKNHKFLIQIFNEIYKMNKNAILLLIGRGELEEEIRKQVESLELTNVVRFLGIREDVSQILQAMDVFLLPSKYEGLPVVLVEAQAAGLKSIVADTITKEVKVTELVTYISLEETCSNWAKETMKLNETYDRKDMVEKMRFEGYDIKQEALNIELFYRGRE